MTAGGQKSTKEQGGISPTEVRDHLDSVLASEDFRASARLSGFLQYIVEQSLAGRAKEIKAYTIAVEVFERDASFASPKSAIFTRPFRSNSTFSGLMSR